MLRKANHSVLINAADLANFPQTCPHCISTLILHMHTYGICCIDGWDACFEVVCSNLKHKFEDDDNAEARLHIHLILLFILCWQGTYNSVALHKMYFVISVTLFRYLQHYHFLTSDTTSDLFVGEKLKQSHNKKRAERKSCKIWIKNSRHWKSSHFTSQNWNQRIILLNVTSV